MADEVLKTISVISVEDPKKVSKLTVGAVDTMGESAAKDVESVGMALVLKAKEIADNLQDLANAIRQHTREAASHVDAYCQKATEVMETVRVLDVRLKDTKNSAKDNNTKDSIKPPVNGPVRTDSRPLPSKGGEYDL